MPSVTIPAGQIEYRVAGPAESDSPPVVFVHGFLVDSRLWDPVADQLAAQGVRSYLVDWPLGSHRTPMTSDADMSPEGIAGMVNAVLDALSLNDVTLVGNDTGGAICQLLVADDASRIGRLVLTNCDAFDNFPPKAFVPLFCIAKHPMLTNAMLAPTRLRLVRHSPLAYGLLLRRPRNAALTKHWIAPATHKRAIRRDIARFTRGLKRDALLRAAPQLRAFEGDVKVVWGTDDRCFTLASGRRLAEAFAHSTFTEAPGASTFISIDAPEAVTAAIVEIGTPAIRE